MQIFKVDIKESENEYFDESIISYSYQYIRNMDYWTTYWLFLKLYQTLSEFNLSSFSDFIFPSFHFFIFLISRPCYWLSLYLLDWRETTSQVFWLETSFSCLFILTSITYWIYSSYLYKQSFSFPSSYPSE